MPSLAGGIHRAITNLLKKALGLAVHFDRLAEEFLDGVVARFFASSNYADRAITLWLWLWLRLWAF